MKQKTKKYKEEHRKNIIDKIILSTYLVIMCGTALMIPFSWAALIISTTMFMPFAINHVLVDEDNGPIKYIFRKDYKKEYAWHHEILHAFHYHQKKNTKPFLMYVESIYE